MGLLTKLFGSSNEKKTELPEIKREDFVDDSDPNEEIIKTEFGTSMPIDAIYAYIEQDYEEQGYTDAMCNADSSYKESKKTIIINGLKRRFQQVNLRYQQDLRTIDVQICIIEEQGMINTASALKARKETYLEHMHTISTMENDLENGDLKILSMIDSYDRGFLRGLAAKSEILLNHGK